MVKKRLEIIFENHVISKDSNPFIIAEVGVNYYDIAAKEKMTLLDAAKLMISKAKEGGAHAVKFQSYKAETLATRSCPSYWDTTQESTKNQFELFKKYENFGEKEYSELSIYSKKTGIVFMSTPFDFESVEYLNGLVDVFKISSSDITNLPFIKYIAKKSKPIFLSTGASTDEEIEEAINAIENEKNEKIVLLHCVLNYPALYENANLVRIKFLQKAFPNYLIGYSDHTMPDKNMQVLMSAIVMGACVIEKHFTLDKTIPGNDHYHAMDTSDLKTLSENIKFYKKILGSSDSYLATESDSRKYARRSIVAKIAIPKGAVITPELVAFKRPGTGISPKEYDKIIGKKANSDISEDELISWDKIHK
jgi:N-acetylneuraminate synthase